MNLTQFKKNPNSISYHIKFDDGIELNLTTIKLRDMCPCAMCKGEEILFQKYVPPQQIISPEGYQLENAKPVGNYAIQLFWKDGHNTGIYTWEYLKKISSEISV